MTRPALSGFRFFLAYWLPVAIYVAAIVFVSAQPRLRPPIEFQNSDRIYHLLEYMGLGLVMVRALRASLRMHEPLKASLLALAIGVAIAVGDELFQSTVPGRMSSHHDVLADAAGLVSAQIVYLWFARDRGT